MLIAINNRGDVLVRCIRDTYMSHNKWFLYSDGSYIDLTPPFVYFGEISDINDSGVMVGYIVDSSWSENQTKGFQYDGGTYKELLPPGWSNSEAIHINNNGTVIGYGSTNYIAYRGFSIIMASIWSFYRRGGSRLFHVALITRMLLPLMGLIAEVIQDGCL